MTLKGMCANVKRRISKYFRYRRMSKKLINRAEKYAGCDVLTPEQKDKIKLYFRKYNRNCSYAFHNYYTKRNGIFNEEYVPEDIFYGIIDPKLNDVQKAKVLDNKCLYKSIFKDIKQPREIACRMNGFWMCSCENRKNIIDIDEVFDLIKEEHSVFIKAAENSYGGHGVFYFNAENITKKDICSAIDSIAGDIVIQEAIGQHKELSRINPDSINTIRVFTYLSRKENVVKICSAVLRMGVGGAKVDNARSGGIFCGISRLGRLYESAYNIFTTPEIKCTKHPNTGVVFKEFTIPNFDLVLDTAKRAAICVPSSRFVAWDFAVSEEGEPILIEPNLYDGGIWLCEIGCGTIFAECADEILSETLL